MYLLDLETCPLPGDSQDRPGQIRLSSGYFFRGK
jgi:hypothetical protein